MASGHHTQDYVRLRTMLRDARISRKVTQADLAAALGKPQSYIAKYEGGERRLDVIELLAILDGLEVSLVGFIRKLHAATDR